MLTRLGLIGEPQRLFVDRMLCAAPAIGPMRQPLHVRFGLEGTHRFDQAVSLHWRSKDLVQGLSELAGAAGKGILLPPGVGGRLSLDLSDIAPAAALHYLVAVNGLESSCDADLITAYPLGSRADHAVSMVIDVPPPARARDLRDGLNEVLLRSQGVPVGAGSVSPEILEVLPAGNALRFVGRQSTAREIRLIVDAISGR